jgi:predicted O-methyltransferase YrrM
VSELAFDDIEGWLSEGQGRALFEAAAATTGRGAIVEIGSWKGRSTAWLAAGAARAGQRVYAVDPHQGSFEDPTACTLRQFLENMRRAGVADTIEPLVMTSSEAAAILGGPIELLFIDANHDYPAVKHDADLWFPKLVTGGTLMMHDVATSSYAGPRRVFRWMVCWNSGFDSIRRVGSMGIARRTTRRNARDAMWGLTAGLLLGAYDAKALLRRIRQSNARSANL